MKSLLILYNSYLLRNTFKMKKMDLARKLSIGFVLLLCGFFAKAQSSTTQLSSEESNNSEVGMTETTTNASNSVSELGLGQDVDVYTDSPTKLGKVFINTNTLRSQRNTYMPPVEAPVSSKSKKVLTKTSGN